MAWDRDKENLLKKLHGEGLSASLIAASINRAFRTGYTRNAVIGKTSRLGLSKSGPGYYPQVSKRNTPRKKRKKRKNPFLGQRTTSPTKPGPGRSWNETGASVPGLKIREAPPAPEANPTSIQLVSARACRWPNGGPKHDDFHLCGAPCDLQEPYCDYHDWVSRYGLPDKIDAGAAS